MRVQDVDDLSEKAVRRRLKELLVWLDTLDNNDELGTEGWRHLLGWDD